MTIKNVLGVDHIALQLPSLIEGLRFFNELLGFKVKLRVTIEGQQIVFLQAGKVELEIWEDSSGDATQLDEATVGVHHLALQVKDLEAIMDYMRDKDVQVLIDIYEPTRGIREAIVQGPGGVRIQFVEQNVPLLIWRSLKGEFKEG